MKMMNINCEWDLMAYLRSVYHLECSREWLLFGKINSHRQMGYVYQCDVENTNMTHFSWSKFIPKINVDNNSNIWRANVFILSLALYFLSLVSLGECYTRKLHFNAAHLNIRQLKYLYFSLFLQWMHSLLPYKKILRSFNMQAQQ